MAIVKRRLSIQKQMFMILGGGLIGFLTYFVINHSVLQGTRESLEKIINVKMPNMERIESLSREISSIRNVFIQSLVSQNFDGIGKVDETHKKIINLVSLWKKDVESDSSSQAAMKVLTEIEVSYTKAYAKLNDITQNIVVGLTTADESQNDFRAEILALAQIETRLADTKKAMSEDLQQTVVDLGQRGKMAIYFGLALMLVGFVVGFVSYLVTKGINDSLLSTNSGVQGTSKRLLEMVEEARVSSQRLRATATQQAASSTETVVSMEQMKRILGQTTRSSTEVRDLSEASLVEATSGKDLVQMLRDSMLDIEKSNKDLEEVTEVVKQVRENTAVINEIVFKTQLLSFNANIEAARAGQHGLGFAVVANEIGSLSEMSGQAAEEINDLLEQSTNKVEKTIAQTKEKIGKANELSEKCFEFFKVITERSTQLKEMVLSISQATTEQNTGVEYVVNAMNELNQSAAETDRMAQGVLLLADGLKNQATNLASVADHLNVIVKGGEVRSGSMSNVYKMPDVQQNVGSNLKDSA